MSAGSTGKSSLIELAKGITDASFVMTPERQIESFNRAFVKTHEVEKDQMRSISGKHCREFVNLEICDSNCILKKSIETGGAVRFDEVKGTTSKGNELNLIVTAVPVRDAQGQIISVLEMHRDVTDEARIHAKYKILLDKERMAKEELENLVAQRTKALVQTNQELKSTQAKLVHSEKMSSVGQLVAGIAHELNNPINFICGNIGPLREYTEDLKAIMVQTADIVKARPELEQQFLKLKEEKDFDFKIDDLIKIVQSIEKGGTRAADIIQGLRTFSRLDEAKLKETDLHADIDTTLTLLRHEYRDRVEIHKAYGNLPKIYCYSSQLNQVFMNLIHNAIQAIEDKGEIWIRTRMEDEKVIVEVQDNGSGISPENLAKIFDPFFTTKEVGKGTGLGLSISYGIVEQHGGKIEVTSAQGKGTTFRVILPMLPPKVNPLSE